MTRRLAAAAMIMAGTLAAHDMWIEPSSFFPQAGQVVTTGLRVGQDLMGDPLARSSVLIRQFVVDDGAGRREVIGREGANPAGLLRVERPGLHVIGYRSNWSHVEQDAEKFRRYLTEEGLDALPALRAWRGPAAGSSVKEVFARCAKSLVLSGGAASGGDHVMGFPLELVAERSPYAAGADASLPVRLTFEGRPLEGALVVAMNKRNPAARIAMRSGKDGRVRLQLPAGGGMWLVKAVHMVPAPADTGAEWASYWASLTFETR